MHQNSFQVRFEAKTPSSGHLASGANAHKYKHRNHLIGMLVQGMREREREREKKRENSHRERERERERERIQRIQREDGHKNRLQA